MATPDDKQAALPLPDHGGGARVRRVEDIGLLDLLEVFASNVRLIVLLPLLLGIAALGATYLITPSFTATARILPPQQQQSMATSMLQSLGALGGLAGVAVGLKNPADQYVDLFRTNAVEDALIKRFSLQDRYEKKYLQDTREVLKKRTTISADKNDIIIVQFDDPDPAFAAAVTNGYIEELGRLLDRLAVTEAQQRRKFFENQLLKTKERLTEAQQVLAASGIGVAAINANPAAAIEMPTRLRAAVTAQELKLAAMRGYLAESASEYQQARAELDALHEQLAKAEQAQPDSEEKNNNDYIAKFRDFKYQETLFELLSRQYEAAKVDESRDGAIIQVIDSAVPPEKKSRPRRALTAIVITLLSSLLITAFIFLRHFAYGADEEVSRRYVAVLRSLRAAILGRGPR